MYLDAGSENKHILYSESFEQHNRNEIGRQVKRVFNRLLQLNRLLLHIHLFLLDIVSVNISVIRKNNNLLHFYSFVKNEISFSVQIT